MLAFQATRFCLRWAACVPWGGGAHGEPREDPHRAWSWRARWLWLLSGSWVQGLPCQEMQVRGWW